MIRFSLALSSVLARIGLCRRLAAVSRAGSAGGAVPTEPLPTDIGPEKHVLWKTELPPGHSSPAIVGDKIFLTAVRDKEHLETICLDRASGKILWRVEAPHKTLEKIHGIGSYAQPSPAADERAGGRDVRLQRPVLLRPRRPASCGTATMGPFNDEFGAAASPIIEDDRVILGQDHDTGSFLAAYDKTTGKQLWRTDRAEFSRGYSHAGRLERRRQAADRRGRARCGSPATTGTRAASCGPSAACRASICMTPAIGDDNTLYRRRLVGGRRAGRPDSRWSRLPTSWPSTTRTRTARWKRRKSPTRRP